MKRKNVMLTANLCGLVLTSFLILNKNSVVHADSVNSANNSAITWDEEADSQAVQESQTKNEQSNVQKADDHQQNATQPAQNSVKTAQTKIEQGGMQRDVQDVTQYQPQLSTVRSSNEMRDIKQDQVSNTKLSAVNDVQADNKVEIKNPANNQIHVHYVDSTGHDIIDKTGKSVDIGDYDISTNNTVQNSSYKTPKDYMLVNSGKYNVNVSHSIEGTLDVTTVKFFGKDGKPAPSSSGMKGNIKLSDSDAETVHRLSVKCESKIIDGLKNGTYKIGVIRPKNEDVPHITEHVPYITEHGGKDIPDLDDFTYAGWLTLGYDNGTFDRIKPSDLQKYNFEVQLIGKTKSGHAFRTIWRGLDASDAATLGGIWTRATGENYKKTIDYIWKEYGNTSSGSYSFMPDYSNAKFIDTSTFDSTGVEAVHGNTVDVAVMRPQSVDPMTNTRLHSSATRTIKINFPGQVPPSYKNIVNADDELVQTVNFTRTGQEDALTNTFIEGSEGPWKSDNKDPNFLGFPERTLPRIPGYTLSIKPA